MFTLENMMIVIKKIVRFIINKSLKLDLTPIDQSIPWGKRDNDSHLFLWGAKTADLFKNRKNVNIVSNPVADNYYNGYFEKRKNFHLLDSLSLGNKKTILISAQCVEDVSDKDKVMYWYNKIIISYPKLNFIIKIHPRDKLKNFKSFKKFNNVKILHRDYSFSSLLEVSDINISHYSATSMDAILYGVPVILLPTDILYSLNLNYWYSSEIFFKPETISSCIDHIEKSLNFSFNENYMLKRKKFIKDMYSDYVGRSRPIIISKINDLLYK